MSDLGSLTVSRVKPDNSDVRDAEISHSEDEARDGAGEEPSRQPRPRATPDTGHCTLDATGPCEHPWTDTRRPVPLPEVLYYALRYGLDFLSRAPQKCLFRLLRSEFCLRITRFTPTRDGASRDATPLGLPRTP